MSAFRESVRVFVAEHLTPAARSAKLAEAARRGVAELVASGRAPPKYRTFVDGAEGRDVATVRREVLYEFAYLGPAIEFALAFLIARSPAKSGRYRAGFVVAVNGRPIPARQFIPRQVPPGAEILIYNVEPYSRKVDMQLIGSKRLRYSVPDGLFDDAAQAVRRRFGNTVSAKRLYTVKFPGQAHTRRGRLVESPALSLNQIQ